MPQIKKILFIIFLLLSQWSMGQMSNYKSLYIYNFIKNIELPQADAKEDFVIIVMGDADTFTALKNIYQTKNIGNRKVAVMLAGSVEEFQDADLIYVGYSKRKHLVSINNWIGKKAVLVVSEYKSSRIADIIFDESSGGLEFYIRPKKITDKGMKLSDELVKLGKTIDN